MKHVISFLYLFVFTCLIMSCSTYIVDNQDYGTQIRPTAKLYQSNFNDQELPSTTWNNLFHGTMTQANGIGNNMKIKIPRLSNSFSDEPLFVVNNTNV